MSIETFFLVDNYLFAVSRSSIDPELMIVFRETDRRVIHTYEDEFDRREFRYEASVQLIKDRMDIMGFTLKHAKEDFDTGIKGLREYIDDDADLYDEYLSGVNPLNILKVVEESTFEDWIRIADIVTSKEFDWDDWKEVISSESALIVLLKDYYEISSSMLPFSDRRFWLRMILETKNPEALVICELSALADDNSVSDDATYCDEAIQELVEGQLYVNPIVILTEGSTDKRYLEKSLKLLFPDLTGYFSFLDFSALNAQGSTGNLVATVKALAGCRLSNRFIAVFDNDTAAKVALKGLDQSKLPNNICVMHLPDMPAAESYPTLGPSGLTNLNINGLAGSIELYFGHEILKLGEDLVPVQWKGFDDSLQKYQGELMNKKELQRRFEEKLKICLADASKLREYDWFGMDLIWQRIFQLARS